MRIPRYTIYVLLVILVLLSGWKSGYFACSRGNAAQLEAPPHTELSFEKG